MRELSSLFGGDPAARDGDDAPSLAGRDGAAPEETFGNVEERGALEVVLDVSCTNQREEVTASGSIRVRLPSRELGMPAFPTPPEDEGILPGMPEPLDGPWAK